MTNTTAMLSNLILYIHTVFYLLAEGVQCVGAFFRQAQKVLKRVVIFRSLEYYSLPIIMYLDCSVGLMYLKKYQEESTKVSIVSVSLLAQQSALHTYITM